MTYDFKCPKCNTVYEVTMKVSEYDEKKDKQYCDCGAMLERVFTPSSAVYHCGGFYSHN